jgi:hypothetical protein
MWVALPADLSNTSMPKRSSKNPPTSYSVECEVEGKVHHGTYQVARGVLTVHGPWGSKSTSPGARPDVLAKIILREIVQEASAKG